MKHAILIGKLLLLVSLFQIATVNIASAQKITLTIRTTYITYIYEGLLNHHPNLGYNDILVTKVVYNDIQGAVFTPTFLHPYLIQLRENSFGKPLRDLRFIMY